MTKDVSQCVRAGLWPGSPSPDLLPVTELPPASWARIGALGPSLWERPPGAPWSTAVLTLRPALSLNTLQTLCGHTQQRILRVLPGAGSVVVVAFGVSSTADGRAGPGSVALCGGIHSTGGGDACFSPSVCEDAHSCALSLLPSCASC